MVDRADLPDEVEINEVGPRDGFQAEDEFIATERKVEIIDALSRTGVAAIQVTSVVHPKAVPQLADAEEVMARIERAARAVYGVGAKPSRCGAGGVDERGRVGADALRDRLAQPLQREP